MRRKIYCFSVATKSALRVLFFKMHIGENEILENFFCHFISFCYKKNFHIGNLFTVIFKSFPPNKLKN